MKFVAVANVFAIVLGHWSTKESKLDWFKLHSPLFSQIAKELVDHKKLETTQKSLKFDS